MFLIQIGALLIAVSAPIWAPAMFSFSSKPRPRHPWSCLGASLVASLSTFFILVTAGGIAGDRVLTEAQGCVNSSAPGCETWRSVATNGSMLVLYVAGAASIAAAYLVARINRER
ncbi:MAG: hypothetical protein AAGE01_22190 [Pseudomonadota bacterium]